MGGADWLLLNSETTGGTTLPVSVVEVPTRGCGANFPAYLQITRRHPSQLFIKKFAVACPQFGETIFHSPLGKPLTLSRNRPRR